MSKTATDKQVLTPAELLAFGQPETAEQRLQNILQKQHDNLEAQIELIRLYLHEGEFERARDEALKARQQWNEDTRIKGLMHCADKGLRRDKKILQRYETPGTRLVLASDKTFHLVRFIFCLVTAVVGFSIFYYYTYYLSDSSYYHPGRGIQIPPLGTLIFHGAFYLIWLMILYRGFKNLLQFLFLPEVIAVREEGLLLKSRLQSLFIPWSAVSEVKVLDKGKFQKKEQYWIFDQTLRIETSTRVGLFARQFLLVIPRSSLKRFRELISSLKDCTRVTWEKQMEGGESA